MPPTVLHVVPHTHWDREWYEPFAVMRYRLVKVTDRLLETLDDPAFAHFMFDGQTAAIEDYLEIRPGAEDDVAAMVSSGKLAIGPLRIVPDEFLCSPETLVRNLQQGHETGRRLGGVMRVGYLPDPFGHVGQMPQLLRQVGITDACLWRGVPHAVQGSAFRWEAPDGSAVRTCYLPFGYGQGAGLPTTSEELIARAERIAEDLAPFEPGGVVLVLNGNDHSEPQAHLPALFERTDGAQERFRFVLGTLASFVRSLPPAEELPAWRGELRSGARANLLMGVLSARVELKQLEFAASTMIERSTEPLTAIAGTDPAGLLGRAWRGIVENSAHDSVTGCGVDEVARDVEGRYREALRLGDLIAADALESLAGAVDTASLAADEEGMLVFNPSPRPRGGTATITLAAPGPIGRLAFEAPDGARGAAQALQVREQVALDMSVRGAQLERLVPLVTTRRLADLFVNGMEVVPGRPTTIRLRMGMALEGSFDVEGAKRRVEELARRSPRARFRVLGHGPPLATVLAEVPPVPGMGWSVLRPVVEGADGRGARADGTVLDNGIVRAEVAPDGTVSLQAQGVRFDGLLGIEESGDAGDEYNYAPPQHDRVVVEPSEPAVVDELRAGPVEAALRVTRRFRVPARLSADGRRRARRMVWMPVVTTVAVRAGEPILRATITVTNEAEDHRIRAIMPLPFEVDGSLADGAFEVVARGLTAEGGPHELGLPTFPCRRWVRVGDPSRGLAVFHRGTPEYEVVDGRALAVTLLRGVGYLSRHGMSTRAGPAGPVIETPGAQVTGARTFELGLYPHTGDLAAARVLDIADGYAAGLRATGIRAGRGTLPARGSALTVGPEQVQLSAVTRDGDRVFVRIYNAGDDPVEATLDVGPPLPAGTATRVDLLGEPLRTLPIERGRVVLPLRSWEIATVRLGLPG